MELLVRQVGESYERGAVAYGEEGDITEAEYVSSFWYQKADGDTGYDKGGTGCNAGYAITTENHELFV